MIHRTAFRNGILGVLAAVTVAGCGATRLSNAADSTVTAPGGPATHTPAVTSSAAPSAALTSGQVPQQINSIDSQLSTIDGQISAANAGLSTSEGDPSQ